MKLVKWETSESNLTTPGWQSFRGFVFHLLHCDRRQFRDKLHFCTKLSSFEFLFPDDTEQFEQCHFAPGGRCHSTWAEMPDECTAWRVCVCVCDTLSETKC